MDKRMILAASIFASLFLLGTICMAQYEPGYQTPSVPGGHLPIVQHFKNGDNHIINDNWYWKNYVDQNHNWNNNLYWKNYLNQNDNLNTILWNDGWNQNNNRYNNWYNLRYNDWNQNENWYDNWYNKRY